ncbi:E3 ubiquitin-protein ligase Zswim2 [Boothiomyces sp. JEL0866]|nr:E3 ubiquitin-protein ligase Zswim2 [Boothiomyces sp. JEL0866]
MATRITEYQRKCPENVQALIDTANTTQLYVLQELGPMAFIVADENNSKKFKMWVLLKLFKVDPASEILYQTSLVDREINEILGGRLRKKPVVVERVASVQEIVDDGKVNQRPVESGDICPICQDDLINSGGEMKVTYCRNSCGNNIHVKCIKILMNHTKSIGSTDVKCPLCRNTFGTISEVEKQIAEPPSVKEPDTRKPDFSHFGYTCKNCNTGPIKGRLHKEHSFEYRNRSTSKWKSSTRSLQPALPSALIDDIQNRELTGDDYQTLLTLDGGLQVQGSIPLHIINSFPVIKLCNPRDRARLRLDNSSNCKVCASKIGYGDLARQIPCGHGFHQSCIDRWLLHSRSNCPTCGSAAYYAVDEEDSSQPPNLNSSNYIATVAASNNLARKKRRETKKELAKPIKEPQFQGGLQIIGSNAISDYSGIPAAAESDQIQRDPLIIRPSKIKLDRKNKRKQSSLTGKKTLGLPPITTPRRIEKKEINLLIDSTKLLLI